MCKVCLRIQKKKKKKRKTPCKLRSHSKDLGICLGFCCFCFNFPIGQGVPSPCLTPLCGLMTQGLRTSYHLCWLRGVCQAKQTLRGGLHRATASYVEGIFTPGHISGLRRPLRCHKAGKQICPQMPAAKTQLEGLSSHSRPTPPVPGPQ